MLVTAFLSMWMSNTSTASIMTPLVMSILKQLKMDKQTEESSLESNVNSIEENEVSIEFLC
jgi:di/tricarboxylate transporter